MRKIDIMHRMFGVDEVHFCKDCSNFVAYGYRGFKKCRICGETMSKASDWRNRYTACGKFNKPYDGNILMKRNADDQPMAGQIDLFKEENK